MMDKKQIGERLRQLRGERSREEIGFVLGVTAQAIANYESGTRVPNDELKLKIARYFGCTVQEIFFD